MRRALHVVAACVERGGLVLLDRRREGSHMAGLWEFPGGKREGEETDEQALERELLEELGCRSRIGKEIARVGHAYEDTYEGFDLTLVLYEVELLDEPSAVQVAEVRWFELAMLRKLEMPPADIPLVEGLMARTVPANVATRSVTAD